MVKDFAEGIKEFRRLYTSGDIGLVVIPSSKTDYHEVMISLISDYGFKVPSEKIFRYVPPRSAGHNPSPREESIPKIADNSLTYLIMDDTFEDGNTLRAAVKRLAEQGIALDRIWFCVAIMMGSSPIGPYLDRACAFLE
jgi:hypothetical protein